MNGNAFYATFLQRSVALSAIGLAGVLPIPGSVAQIQEPDMNIIADQVRSQGFQCNPVSAEHVAAESSPGNEVYVLRCDGIAYRVQIIPDQASKITKLD